MKKIIVFAISIILLFSATVMPISAAQADNEIAQPYWTNTNSIDAAIGFINGVGYAEAALTGKFGSTATFIDVVVYKQSGNDWIYITEAHTSATIPTVTISCPFEITAGTYYKAEYTFKVERNGTGEVVARDVYRTYEG